MKRPELRVGLIGLGAIGQGVVRLIQALPTGDIELTGALVRDPARPRPAGSPVTVARLDELLAADPDVVVEAAGHGAIRAHGPGVLRSGRDLIFIAVGALADTAFEQEIRAAAEAGNSRARVASGAIGALDALAAAAVGGLDRVTHISEAPAHEVMPEEEASRLTEAREVFHGSARQGALRFPTMVNIAAAVGLAGIGMDRSELRVIAVPNLPRSRQTVEAEGAFGSFRFDIRHMPDPDPRASRLVAMSIVHELLKWRARLVVG